MQVSSPVTPPAQSMPLVMVRGDMAALQVASSTTGSDTWSRRSEESPPKDVAPQPNQDVSSVYYKHPDDLTVSQSRHPVKGGGVSVLGHTGWSVNGEVHRLGQLDDCNVVVVGCFVVALMVGVGRHRYLLENGFSCGGGKIMLSQYDLY